MATSLQYQFPTIDADLIIRDAFERCGIWNYLEDALRYQSARRSLNLLLQHWPNKGFNLFTFELGILPIIAGQNVYELPLNTSKILQCKMANANRILGGTPQSNTTTSFDNAGGGTASAPFTTTYSGNCIQTSLSGNISYTYTTAQPILTVGIMSGITAVYQFYIECSFISSPSEDDWITILQTPLNTYYFGETQWYYLPFTKSALNWRIRDVAGISPINIGQILFDIPYISLPMKSVGNDLYFQFPSNAQQGLSTTYWVNRIRTPTLNVWPVPIGNYQFFYYSRIRYIQDVGDFFNSIDISARFVEAATAGLAAKLAQKFAPDRFADLANEAEKVYVEAGKEDTENVDSLITWAVGE
jgi:hypothetical protein